MITHTQYSDLLDYVSSTFLEGIQNEEIRETKLKDLQIIHFTLYLLKDENNPDSLLEILLTFTNERITMLEEGKIKCSLY